MKPQNAVFWTNISLAILVALSFLLCTDHCQFFQESRVRSHSRVLGLSNCYRFAFFGSASVIRKRILIPWVVLDKAPYLICPRSLLGPYGNDRIWRLGLGRRLSGRANSKSDSFVVLQSVASESQIQFLPCREYPPIRFLGPWRIISRMAAYVERRNDSRQVLWRPRPGVYRTGMMIVAATYGLLLGPLSRILLPSFFAPPR